MPESDLTTISTEDLEEIRVALRQRLDLLDLELRDTATNPSRDMLNRAGERATDLLNRVVEELSWR